MTLQIVMHRGSVSTLFTKKIRIEDCITIRVLTLQEDGVEFVYNENTMVLPDNYMDRWVTSFTQSLIKFVKAEMTGKKYNNEC